MCFGRTEESVYADPIRKVQEQLYEQLLAIREGVHQTLVSAITEAETAAASTPAATQQTAEAPKATGEADPKLAEENEKLKAENKKLEYRIVHLLRTIDSLEAAQQAPQ